MLFHLLSAVGLYLNSEWIRPMLGGSLGSIILVNTLLILAYIAMMLKLEWRHLSVRY